MIETVIFGFVALCFLILLYRWMRANSLRLASLSAQSPGPFRSPFLLAEIARRVFDPADYALLRGNSPAGTAFLFERKQLALLWCARGRHEAFSWLVEHRRAAAAADQTSVMTELRAIGLVLKVVLLTGTLELLIVLFGPHRGGAWLRMITSWMPFPGSVQGARNALAAGKNSG